MLGETLETFNRLTKHPERFLESRNETAEKIRNSLKQVYDHMKEHDKGNTKKNYLPKLIIENFDDEQIWQELELHNSIKYSECLTKVSSLLSRSEDLSFHLVNKKTWADDDSEDEESRDADVMDDDHEENKYSNHESMIKKERIKKKRETSIVDDKFFKLSELEEFLKEEDQKEDNKKQPKKGDLSDSELIDYFQETAANEEEEEGVFYDEFFDPPDEIEEIPEKPIFSERSPMQENVESDNSSDFIDEDRGITGKKKKVMFDLSPSLHSSDESIANDREFDEQPESNLNKRQKRLQARIDKLEQNALEDKPWQMKGEVDALSRPQNSLLEEILEFDMTTRPAPVMTEQTTYKLEDIILLRIKDKSWDDVERKVKPILAPDEYKKKIVMNQEKSKLSLAEVYEQEYLQKKAALNPAAEEEKEEEEPQEHRTIRSMMSALFSKLDALTNFLHTPKMVIPEVKIVSNLPAIAMEEVVPVATSDATLLAPKEIKVKKRFDPMESSERTDTDKKRKRRLIKKKKRLQQKEKEKIRKIVDKLRPGLGNKYSKEKVERDLKELGKAKNVEQVNEKQKTTAVRSSTAFFGRLEEEKSILKTNSVKKVKKDISAKKLKL